MYTAPVGPEPRLSIPAQAAEDDYVLSLEGFLRVLRKRLWLILLVTVALVGASAGFTFMQTPVYESSIKVLVGQEQGPTTPGALGGDVQGLQQVTKTMAEGVNSRPVAEAVIQQLGLSTTSEAFLSRLNAEPISDTQFIQIDYRDSSPERAQQAANSVGDVFSKQVSQVSPSANAVTATVWERAKVPDDPVSPNVVLNITLALVVGLTLGAGLAFLLEHLDDSWRSSEEAEQITGVPTFGVIPELEEPTSKNNEQEERGKWYDQHAAESRAPR